MTKSYELEPTNITIGKELLKILINDGGTKRAKNLAKVLLTEFSSDGQIANSAAKLYILEGEYTAAKSQLNRALELEPDDINVWISHLNYYAQMENVSKFKFWASRIMKKDSTKLNENDVTDILDSML